MPLSQENQHAKSKQDTRPATKAFLSKIETLQQEATNLRQEIAELQDEKAELELLLDIHTQHSDELAGQLLDKVERTLRENARRFRSIVKATPIPIIISRVSDGEIVYTNSLTGPLLGLSSEDVLGCNLLDFYKEPTAPQIQQMWDILLQQGVVNDYELQLKRVDETTLWASVSIQPLTFNGESCFLNMLYDLTERRRAEKERARLASMQQELDLAQQIQERLLPVNQPNWPNLDLICYTASARSVGGDFYAYHPFALPQNSPQQRSAEKQTKRFAIAVGDVSGKGMPAALLMSVSFSSLQAMIEQALQPDQLLTQLDQTIGLYTKTTHQNCALCYAEITLTNSVISDEVGFMRVANAGCMEPIIRRADGSLEWVEVVGIPLGSQFGRKLGYKEATIPLRSGDFIILTSDGVVEAMTDAKELFGFERFERAVAAGPTTTAEAMLAHLRAEVTAFIGDIEVQDDFTIVILRV